MSQTETTKIEIGDEVTFHGGTRGRHKGMQTGIVVGFHYKEFRGRRKEMSEMFGGESGVEVLKVQVGTTIWKIGKSLVKVTRKAVVEKREAVSSGSQRQAEIRHHNRMLKHQQQSENFNAMDTAGLSSLRVGDRIEVQLHDRYGVSRWYPAFFNGVVAGSGRIKVRQESFPKDRLFSTPPKFVRIPEEK